MRRSHRVGGQSVHHSRDWHGVSVGYLQVRHEMMRELHARSSSAAGTSSPAAGGSSAADTIKQTAAIFPENVKQALLRKARSRFAQPHEAGGAAPAAPADALRITLVERGGSEVATRWLPLPAPPG